MSVDSLKCDICGEKMTKRLTTPIIAQKEPYQAPNGHIQHIVIKVIFSGRENNLIKRPNYIHAEAPGRGLMTTRGEDLELEETVITDQEFDACEKCQLLEAQQAIQGLLEQLKART